MKLKSPGYGVFLITSPCESRDDALMVDQGWMGNEMKRKRSKIAVYGMLIFSWLILMPGPEAASAHGKVTKNLKSLDKFQIKEIEHGLREDAQRLSLLKQDLYLIFTSMTSFQAKERFQVLGCQEDVARVQGVYVYVADMLGQFLLTKEDRIPYYSYLEEEGIGEMKDSVNQYLAGIERARAQITDKSALSLIDKSIETIGSSLDLLNRVNKFLKQHSRPEELGANTDPVCVPAGANHPKRKKDPNAFSPLVPRVVYL